MFGLPSVSETHSVALQSSTTPNDPKELWVTYVLWFFGGFLGIHKFYLGKVGWGILYLLTGGIFGIGLLVDLFLIPSQVRRYNESVGALPPRVYDRRLPGRA